MMERPLLSATSRDGSRISLQRECALRSNSFRLLKHLVLCVSRHAVLATKVRRPQVKQGHSSSQRADEFRATR